MEKKRDGLWDGNSRHDALKPGEMGEEMGTNRLDPVG